MRKLTTKFQNRNLLKSLLLLAFMSLGLLPSTSAHAGWRIENQWSQDYWEEYEWFVEKMLDKQNGRYCSPLQSCVKNYIPYMKEELLQDHPRFDTPAKRRAAIAHYKERYDDEILGEYFSGDCADFPYMILALFSYMNDLPFSFHKISGSHYGSSNKPSTRNFVSNGDSLKAVWREIKNTVHSGVFRIKANYDYNSPSDFPDYYPAALNSKAIRPGTIVYDANGHVLLVFKLEANGVIRLADGHPDNTVTRKIYGEKYSPTAKKYSAGFKNWRPVNYNSSGSRVLSAKTNSELSRDKLLSYEQFTDENVRRSGGNYKMRDTGMEYYDHVRSQMSGGDLKYNPVDEAELLLTELCNDAHDREEAVNKAISDGIHNYDQPARLPDNIYGTQGTWETYSTPSRDARFKTGFRELQKRLERFVSLIEAGDPLVEYNGSIADLKKELLSSYKKITSDCVIEYKNTAAKTVKLNLEQIENRLWDLSFDPYHCVELRWGANPNGTDAQNAEAQSCRQASVKYEWYEAQQRLRNQIERTYDVPMSNSLSGLKNRNTGSGVDTPPHVDIRGFIESL